MHRFKHELIYIKQKGTFKAYCRCNGMQTPKLDSENDVQRAYTAHLTLSGIMERKQAVTA